MSYTSSTQRKIWKKRELTEKGPFWKTERKEK